MIYSFQFCFGRAYTSLPFCYKARVHYSRFHSFEEIKEEYTAWQTFILETTKKLGLMSAYVGMCLYLHVCVYALIYSFLEKRDV